MALTEGEGLPIALSLHPAGPHESTLAFDLVQACVTEDLPERVIGDTAYDSDPLDVRFDDIGVSITHAGVGTRLRTARTVSRRTRPRMVERCVEASVGGNAQWAPGVSSVMSRTSGAWLSAMRRSQRITWAGYRW